MANNLLSAASVWSAIGSVALAILILLVMITIHEFGHYIAGKIFRFEISEFSIGFGPAIFKHRSKKTGELFAVRIIPLGGYCAFAGEDGLEEEEEKKKEKKGKEEKEKNAEPFAEISAQQESERIEITPPREEQTPDLPADPSSDGLGSSSNLSANSSSKTSADLSEDTPNTSVDKSRWFTNRPCWQRIIVLVSGALMNYLLALVLILIGFVSYGQTMVAVYEAEEASDEYLGHSLQDLDILLEVNGKSLYLTSDIAHALNGKKAGEQVKIRVSRAYDVEWTEDETGNKSNPTYDHREETEVSVILRSDVVVRNSADFTSVWAALGVKYYEAGGAQSEGYSLANAIYKFGFGEALGRGFMYSFKIAGSIFTVLGELLTGKLGLSAFGGPVTTIRMTSQIASRGFRYFLEIAGYIGVNLAIFNLLPIPALDGSKVVFTLIEWVRGKPISRKVEAIIHAVGFILLLGFAVLVDILQFI